MLHRFPVRRLNSPQTTRSRGRTTPAAISGAQRGQQRATHCDRKREFTEILARDRRSEVTSGAVFLTGSCGASESGDGQHMSLRGASPAVLRGLHARRLRLVHPRGAGPAQGGRHAAHPDAATVSTRSTAFPYPSNSTPRGRKRMAPMEAMLLTLALTNVLLVIGIIGTIVGITHLVYPSRGRRER